MSSRAMWLAAIGVVAAAPMTAPASPRPGTERVVAAKKAGGKSAKKKGKRGGKTTPEIAPIEAPTGPAPEAVPPPPDLPAPPPLPTSYRAVAVLPIVSIDVDDELMHVLEVAIMREIDETPGLRSISPRDVQSDLTTYKLTSACEDGLPCLARAGRYARAHLALDTRIAAIGGTLNISMRLIDTQTEAEIGRVADPVSEDANERAQELHRLAVQLLMPATYVGALQIKCRNEGAEIYLDDKLVGTAPLKDAISGLRAGPHVLRVSKPGFADVYRFVDVVYKRSATIEVDLSANTIAAVIVEEVSATGFGLLYVDASEPGIEIRIDGEPKGVTVLSGPIDKIAAGKRRLSLHREGSPTVAKEIVIEAGRRTDVTVQAHATGLELGTFEVVAASAPLPSSSGVATASPPDTAQAVAAERTWRTTSGLVVAGLGVVSFGIGAYYGWQVLKAEGEQEDIIEKSEDPNLTGDDWAKLRDDLRANDTEGINAAKSNGRYMKLGGALLVVGGALCAWDYFRGRSADADAESGASVAVAPFGGGALFVVAGGF